MRETERRVGSRAERLEPLHSLRGTPKQLHPAFVVPSDYLVGIRHLSSVLPQTLLPIQGLAGHAKGGWLIRSRPVVEAAKAAWTSVEPALNAASLTEGASIYSK